MEIIYSCLVVSIKIGANSSYLCYSCHKEHFPLVHQKEALQEKYPTLLIACIFKYAITKVKKGIKLSIYAQSP